MEKNFKLTLEYDGSAYSGWQRQKDPNTIQGILEEALRDLTGSPTPLTGSGRTDAGVHALGQTANFHADTRLPPPVLMRALNARLPKDMVILSCEEVPESFHARFDTISKLYRYRFLNRPLPAAVGRHYAWHISPPLNIPAMEQALMHLRGTHDFKAFEGAGSPRAHSVRNIFRAELICGEGGHLDFEIEADGFLRHMVRNIVGTLVDVGLSRLSPSDVEKIRDARDRGKAGITAPAHGLFLVRVDYPAAP